MKAIFTAILILALSGCGTVQNPYDSTEYELWVRMLYSAQELNGRCGTDPKLKLYERLNEVYKEARVMSLYADYTPINDEVATAATIIANDVDEMREFYRTNEHNVTYCSRKTALIVKKIEAIVAEIPTRIRR